MILSRLDQLEASMRLVKDGLAKVSKMSTQTYSSVVELHPRANQIAQTTEKVRICMDGLLERLEQPEQG